MQKLLLVSIWLVTIFLPLAMARDASPQRGIRRLLLAMTGFVFFYVFSLIYILPRLPG